MRYRRRGRPKSTKPERDQGTKELQAKRAAYETEEWLDRYYRLEAITREQYWCGNHFRWLYTLRYGVPNAKIVDLGQDHGLVLEEDHEQWMARMSRKYKEAEAALSEAGMLDAMLHMVIDGQCTQLSAPMASQPPQELLQALEILVDLWCKYGRI